MAKQESTANYPDILGAITGGQRLNIDVVQCALATRPARVPAGHVVQLILMMQNAADIDVDITIETELPKQDLGKQKNRFVTKSPKLLIGLRPAETGYAILPVATAPNTKPGEGYMATLTLKIKRMSKKLQRIRHAEGGGQFVFADLAENTQVTMRELRELAFSTDNARKKDRIQVPFTVLPPAGKGEMNLQADYRPLWTMSDFADDFTLAQQVWEPAQAAVQNMKRDKIFMPLLKATQEHFQECGYPLHPPEAIYITKLMTVVAEKEVEDPSPKNPRPAWPRWFTKLCRVLTQEPALAAHPEVLVAHQLYPDLIYCAALQGFAMVSNVTQENFGSPDETSDYSQNLAAALEEGQQLDFARAYLPLVLGGLIANTRVTMPREQVRETVFILSKALEKRQAERNESNDFVFDIAANLVERALDML